MKLLNLRKKRARLCALHIDDSRWIRIPVSVLLRRQFGMRVLEASNGTEGVEIAVRDHPDLIILDIMMPQVDGFDTLTRLKANERTKDIPVLMCTARTQTREVNLAIQLGALAYITKPIDEEELIKKVHELLVSTGKWDDVAAVRDDLRIKPSPVETVHGPGAPLPSRTAPDAAPARACPHCKGALTFISQYSAWYCYPCRKYPDIETAPHRQ